MVKKVLALLFILFISFSFSACNSKYTIIFNAKGGELVDYVIANRNEQVDLPVATKKGHIFEGWYTSKDYGITLDEEFTESSKPDSNSITLYAKWQKDNYTIGGSFYDVLMSIAEDNDGNLVAVGHTYSNNKDITDGNNGGYDTMICKLDSTGEVIWNKTIGGSYNDRLWEVIIDSDGNYVAVGSTNSNDYDIEKSGALAIKLDSDGNIIWINSYGDYLIYEFDAIIEDNDGNYVLIGDFFGDENSYAGSEAFLAKIDKNGELKFLKAYGGSRDETFNDIIQDSDGNYVAVGRTNSRDYDITDGNNGGYDALIMKIDVSGNILWHKTYGSTKNDSFKSIVENENNRYVLMGYGEEELFCFDNDYTPGALVMELNPDGTILWYNDDISIEGYDAVGLSSMIIDNDGSYVLVGATYHRYVIENGWVSVTYNLDLCQGLLIKLSKTGHQQDYRLMGGYYYDKFFDLVESSTGYYICVGATESHAGDITDGFNGVTDALIWFEERYN
jgi:uncharacterized repeat protein (TIGR02543 family)